MNILYVTPAFYPATYWGGPIFSTKNLCDGLAKIDGVELRVLATDAAGPAHDDRLNLDNNPATFLPGYNVYYARRILLNSVSLALLARLIPMIKWSDVIHLTGVYSFPTIPTLIAAKLLNKPVVWSPRGSLQATEEWRAVPNRRTKVIYEKLCQFVRPSNTVLHVTAEIEQELSVKRLTGIKTALIHNSVDTPFECSNEKTWRPDGALRLLFISRIHQKKGLDILLDVMLSLPDNVVLDIYGTGEKEYVEQLKMYVNNHGLMGRVTFHGHVDGSAKELAFRNADLFVLPTHTENFGIAIAEALAYGIPVITTHHAPWKGIELEDCGAWIELDTDKLRDAILDMQDKDLAAMGRRGCEWMKRDYAPVATVAKMMSVYRELITNN